MYRKNVNFNSTTFKVFTLYLFIYFLTLVLKYNNSLDDFLVNIEYRYLILVNIFTISLGLPLSFLFDFLLIKYFGFFYIIFFAPVLTLIGFLHITLFRNKKIDFLKINFLKNNKPFNFFDRKKNKPINIIIIRTFPIFPFLFGGYIIANSNNSRKTIFTYSLIGSYLYYLSIFLIIYNG